MLSSSTACPPSQPFHFHFPSPLRLPHHQFPCLLSCSLILFTFSSPMIVILPRAILPLPPSLFYMYFISDAFPPLHPHRHSSLIPVELSNCFSCVYRWEIIWKLAARLSPGAASAFIPCSVAMTITRPQPAKAANDRLAIHFLVSNSVWFKEALYNCTQSEENRQT